MATPVIMNLRRVAVFWSCGEVRTQREGARWVPFVFETMAPFRCTSYGLPRTTSGDTPCKNSTTLTRQGYVSCLAMLNATHRYSYSCASFSPAVNAAGHVDTLRALKKASRFRIRKREFTALSMHTKYRTTRSENKFPKIYLVISGVLL